MFVVVVYTLKNEEYVGEKRTVAIERQSFFCVTKYAITGLWGVILIVLRVRRGTRLDPSKARQRSKFGMTEKKPSKWARLGMTG